MVQWHRPCRIPSTRQEGPTEVPVHEIPVLAPHLRLGQEARLDGIISRSRFLCKQERLLSHTPGALRDGAKVG